MKSPATNNGRRATPRSTKMRRSALMKFALAVALAVPALVFLTRPTTSYGVGAGGAQIVNPMRAK